MKNTKRIFSTIYGDFVIDTVADAKMAEVFARGDYHQKDTIELLSSFAGSESIFVDGGAHIGTIAIPLAHKTAQTIAYEANFATCTLLQENCERNRVSIDVRQKGLGAYAGHGKMMKVREGNAGAHTIARGEGDVEIVTLDDELPKFDVLKLDVEGMEFEVLQGARRIIGEAHPVILFEVNLSRLRAHATSLHEFKSFFRIQKYYLYLPFRLHGTLVLGRVPSLPIVTLLMYPGAYLLHHTSSTFDIVALSKEYQSPISVVSVCRTLWYVFAENLRDKRRRIRRFFV